MIYVILYLILPLRSFGAAAGGALTLSPAWLAQAEIGALAAGPFAGIELAEAAAPTFPAEKQCSPSSCHLA